MRKSLAGCLPERPSRRYSCSDFADRLPRRQSFLFHAHCGLWRSSHPYPVGMMNHGRCDFCQGPLWKPNPYIDAAPLFRVCLEVCLEPCANIAAVFEVACIRQR